MVSVLEEKVLGIRAVDVSCRSFKCYQPTLEAVKAKNVFLCFGDFTFLHTNNARTSVLFDGYIYLFRHYLPLINSSNCICISNTCLYALKA